MNNKDIISINFDTNLLNSAAFAAVLTGGTSHSLIEFFLKTLLDSLGTVNTADVVFVTLALEIIAESLKTHFNNEDSKFYAEQKKDLQVISIHKTNEDHNEDHKEGGES